jgi:polar amino acid transport system substrate-binding protein
MVLLKKRNVFKALTVLFLMSISFKMVAQEVEPCSVCAIGLSFPLSNEKLDTVSKLQGIYNDIAAEIAKKQGKTLDMHYIMQAYFSRPVRYGLLANKCNAQMGLPIGDNPKWYMPKKVLLSKGFMKIGYAIVVPMSMDIKSLEDLKGKTVAVQGGSPPQMAISVVGGIESTYFLDAEPAMKALADGKVQAAFIWGPTAGYMNKYHYDNKYKVIPTDFVWHVGIGFRAEDEALRDSFNKIIDEITPNIQALEEKYGFPKGEIVKMPPIPMVAAAKE